ncbi:LppP/LprE family lipoprotein [Nodosilinea nodulosa]|uniref:LppP/LprE family lipoprotein n=1 Tax=Nodosilinea nodulosa TaxID=416001 RepID=UPI0002EB43D4|nr:LppP/LprE family lipoprotein [Nodosilinea nodulosa]
MKSFISLISGALVTGSMLLAPVAMAQPDEGGAWLDGVTNWNEPSAPIPAAPVIEGGGNLSSCLDGARPPALYEDALVESAGWTLTGAAQIFGDTTVVTGMANADGMCRPLAYQVFVFTKGKFSGTLSPTPMDSRTDGSLVTVDLYREGYLSASFNRYTPDDALCCASQSSSLFYQVEPVEDSPVLMPQLPANTSPNS